MTIVRGCVVVFFDAQSTPPEMAATVRQAGFQSGTLVGTLPIVFVDVPVGTEEEAIRNFRTHPRIRDALVLRRA